MAVRTRPLTVDTIGSAGAAGGTAVKGVDAPCRIRGIFLDYDPSAPATTDLTITTGDGRTVLTRTNSATDGFFRPQENLDDVLGVDIPGTETAGPRFADFHVKDHLIVVLEECDELSPAVTVTFQLDYDD